MDTDDIILGENNRYTLFLEAGLPGSDCSASSQSDLAKLARQASQPL